MINIYYFGKIKNKNLKNEIEYYSKKIDKVKLISIKENKERNPELIKKKEFLNIKEKIKNDYNILLMEKGKEYDTIKFCEYIEKKIKNINKNINFIINGPFGPSQELINFCDETISLSRLTFLHETSIYLLLEQLYRCQCIKNNIPYHK